MKKILMTLALCVLGGLGVAAEDVLLYQSDFKAPGAGAGFSIWHPKEMAVETKVADGKVSVEVKKKEAEKPNAWQIQFIVPYGKGFTAGATYRLEATLQSSADVTIPASISLNKAPWTGLVSRNISLKANQPAKLELKLTPKEDLAGSYRVPLLALANAPVGAVIEISDVKLYEVK